MMFAKHSKTPLHDHHHMPNAALVPQTEVQSRHQPRYRRNSSSSTTSTQRPGRACVSGKENIHAYHSI